MIQQNTSGQYAVEFYVARQWPDETIVAKITALVDDNSLAVKQNFRERLTKALSEWSGSCKTGIKEYKHAGEHFNIGDLSGNLNNSKLTSILAKYSIHSLKIESLAGETHNEWTFDDGIINDEDRAICGWLPESVVETAQLMGFAINRSTAEGILIEVEEKHLDEAVILSEEQIKSLIAAETNH